MDILKVNKKIVYILIVFLVALILYYKPLFSNNPLGLDTLGHLSKVSYLKEFGSVKWDASWYNGGPFLKFYPPLYYYFVMLFSNVYLGSNLACFLSIILTALGIFLIVDKYSNVNNSLIASLFFLSVINIHYYWIVVGNQPFLFALWTIPFSIFFLDKALEKKIYFLPYSLIFLIGILSHIFIGLCLSLIVFIRLIFNEKNVKGFFKKSYFIIIPLGLSCFWLLPFLTHSSSYVGETFEIELSIEAILGFITELFGLGNYLAWGIGSFSIGLSLIIYLIALFKFFPSKNNPNFYKFLIITSVILFLLSIGILGKYYPTGIAPIRFFPIFSIFLAIIIGIMLKDSKKEFYFISVAILTIALIINYNFVMINYNEHSYCCNDLKYGKFANIYDEFSDFSFLNETEYRFGAARFPFSKSFTYVFPEIPQTSGYYDQGILYQDTFFKMKEGIWYLNDTNKTLYYLDWFGIKYLELSGGYLESEWKFKNKSFKLVYVRNSTDYPYKIYEYKKAKPIISVMKTNLLSYETIDENEIEKMASENKNTEVIVPFISREKINISNKYLPINSKIARKSPDYIEIESDFDGKSAVLFREFYDPSWKAKEYPNEKEISIYQTANNLMLIIPEKNANKIIIYQSKSRVDYIGIITSIIFLILLFYASFDSVSRGVSKASSA